MTSSQRKIRIQKNTFENERQFEQQDPEGRKGSGFDLAFSISTSCLDKRDRKIVEA